MTDLLWQNVRYALRLLRISPGFAIAAIGSLALGTGANTAIFQIFDAIRLRMLPVKAPQQLVELRIDDMTHARGTWIRPASLTTPLWEEVRDHQHALSGTFAWADIPFSVGSRGELRRVAGLWVSGDFFRVLGIQPSVGRLIGPDDDRAGCGTARAVISYDYWHREFGGDPSVVGKTIMLERECRRGHRRNPARFFRS